SLLLKKGVKNLKRLTKRNNIGWFFLFLATLVISVFYFYPMIQALLLSFQTGKGANLEYTEIDNYIRLFNDPTVKTALFNTLLYLIIQVPIMIILALVFSVLLNDATLKFRVFFITAIFIPFVISFVAYSEIFKYIFGVDGIVNTILVNMSIISEPVYWLADPIWAKVIIILAITWRWTGYNMIFYLSSLQNIDQSVYEAA